MMGDIFQIYNIVIKQIYDIVIKQIYNIVIKQIYNIVIKQIYDMIKYEPVPAGWVLLQPHLGIQTIQRH